MRFLADHDVYKLTIEYLREWGHDVITIKELGMSRASDEDLLNKARETNRLLITRDKDFGGLLFLKEKIATGVIFLRGNPRTFAEVHQELQRLLKEHSEGELKYSFCVVESGRHQIRRLGSSTQRL